MHCYDGDIIAWANEQAELIRAGRFDLLDLEHIADEIEDVGKAERRDFSNSMTVLLANLLKWKFLPDGQGSCWKMPIQLKRKVMAKWISNMPSLNTDIEDPEWWELVWADALIMVTKDSGLAFERFPETCPWSYQEIVNLDFYP